MNRAISVCFIIAIWSQAATTVFAVPHYRVIDLGVQSHNAATSAAVAINDAGQVVGAASTPDGDRAFLWTPEGGMQLLGGYSGDVGRSGALGINSTGKVVGYIRNGRGLDLPYYWLSPDTAMPLPVLDTQVIDGGAFAVNDFSEIAGNSHDGSASRAVRWDAERRIFELGQLGNTNNLQSFARAINNTNEIVGLAYLNNNDYHAFKWSTSTGMQDLGDFPGGSNQSEAWGINEAGQVAGFGQSGPSYRAFRWSASEGLRNLGDLPGGNDSSLGYAINDLGYVVGQSEGTFGTRAFLWTEADGMLDLNDLLVSNDADWRLQSARGINNAGMIVGYGSGDRFLQHAFLLVPVPEPSTLTLLVLAVPFVLFTLRQHRRKGAYR